MPEHNAIVSPGMTPGTDATTARPGPVAVPRHRVAAEAHSSIDRVGPWVLVAFGALVLALEIAHAWRFTVDDTYITLRYSRNVAEGLGPTFNATGPRAEGYTTFLWMLLLVVPHLVGINAVVVAKALGVASTAATLAVTGRWAWREGRCAWSAAAAVTCLAAIPATAVHAVSGMETALFTLLLTALFAASADQVRRPRPSNVVVVLALLVGLTRPEGNLAAFVVIATTAALLPRASRQALAFRAIAGWVLPMAAYELWRNHYYGLAFPLPFYVKLASPGLLPGWPDVREWLGASAFHVGVLVLPALVVPPRSIRPALAATAALTAFFVLPQHQMGYDHRYLAPLDPTLAVLAGVGLARLAARAVRFSPAVVHAAVAATIVLVAALGAAVGRGVIAGEVEYGQGLAQAHERLGRELRALGLSGARLAVSDAGAVPYLSGWWTLDLIGLNDARIATSGRRDPASVLAERPDVIVLASARTDRFEAWDWNPWEEPLFDACKSSGYERVALRRFSADYWLWVMAQPGSAVARGLSDVPL
jgi:arabinofuranosyltransferase